MICVTVTSHWAVPTKECKAGSVAIVALSCAALCTAFVVGAPIRFPRTLRATVAQLVVLKSKLAISSGNPTFNDLMAMGTDVVPGLGLIDR